MMNNNQIAQDNEPKEEITPLNGSLTKSSLGKKLLIRGENPREFEVFKAKIEEQTPTYTEIENILLENFISSAWKLKRAKEIEKNLLNNQYEVQEFDEPLPWGSKKRRVRNIKKVRLFQAEIQHIMQYQIDTEKAMQKALERLREEQKLSVKPLHNNGKK